MEQMRWTNENLWNYAIPPVMGWLVQAAHSKSTISYSQVAQRLVDNHGFANFETVARRVGGYLPGRVMPMIDDLVLRGLIDRVPPLNVLMVKETTGLPGIGVCRDLANWYGDNPENAVQFEGRIHKLRRMAESGGNEWSRVCRQAIYAVYQYPNWTRICELLVEQGAHNNLTIPDLGLGPELEPQEPDSIVFMGGGEGEEHRRLKEWVGKHPEIVNTKYHRRPTCTEFYLKSGDWVDVAIFLPYDTIVAVEVKSRVSNKVDLERGVYQCIKYRAVIKAMGMESFAVLVTERELPSNLVALSRTQKVVHLQVRRHGQGYGVVTC